MNRLEALSDGVFAIAITLLVLNLRLPLEYAAVGPQLPQLAPSLFAYVLSFAIVGVYWVAHHTMLGSMQNVSRTLWWPNLLVLLTVAFLPFPAGVLGAHVFDAGALRLYGASLCAVNAAGILLWLSAARAGCLRHLPQRFVRNSCAVHAAPIVVYAAAMIAAGDAPIASLALFFAVPVFFIISAPWLPAALGLEAKNSG